VRPFVPLNYLAAHWTGGPVAEEYRLIYWQGKRILTFPYHDIGANDVPDFSRYDKLSDPGDPILIELNSGGCAGFPPQMHPIEFYSKIQS